MVGMISSDSTIVYYTLTGGLVPPESADDQNTAKLKQRRKLQRRHKTQHSTETAVN